MFWIVFISVALIVGVALILAQRQPVDRDLMGGEGPEGLGYRYQQFRPLTETEQVLYWRLVEALPECVVIPKAPFNRFIKPPEAGEKISVRRYRAMAARMAQKKVDFLVCLRDFTVVATVDLDDPARDARRDLSRDELLKSAGIVPLRVFAEAIPSVEALREMFTASR